jgi:curli biogenesis system outer membrane secretion channel CsgG
MTAHVESRKLLGIAALAMLLAGCDTTQVSKQNEIAPLDVVQLKQRPPLPLSQRKRVAVLEFEDKTDYGSGRLGRSASSILTTFLIESGQFALYERERIDQVFLEQNIATDRRFDPATAVAVGKTAGVELVVIGTVSNFGYRSRRDQALFLGSQVVQEAEATVDVRIIDVATGRIVASESGRGVVTKTTGEVLGVGSSAGYDETIAGNALRAAISKYVDKLIDESAYTQ